MKRICPVCHTPLQPIALKHRLQLDFCLTCRGLWFDKNELSQVQTQTHGQIPAKLLGPSLSTRDRVVCEACGTSNARTAKHCGQCGRPLYFLCPVCHKQMEEVSVGKVCIDRCKSCQGVWLDGGELQLLFDEFKQRKQAELAQAKTSGNGLGADLTAWATIDAIDTLIWTPEILYHTGEFAVEAAAKLPGVMVDGAGAVIEGIAHVPEIAGSLAEGTMQVASGAAELAGDVIGNLPEIASGAAGIAGDLASGALDLVGNVPEIAGAAAEVGASFIEMVFDLISSIFDS